MTLQDILRARTKARRTALRLAANVIAGVDRYHNEQNTTGGEGMIHKALSAKEYRAFCLMIQGAEQLWNVGKTPSRKQRSEKQLMRIVRRHIST